MVGVPRWEKCQGAVAWGRSLVGWGSLPVPVSDPALRSCRPCVSRATTSHTGCGCQRCGGRTRACTSAACRTTATTTRRSTGPRRCCACSRGSHRPTCRPPRPCPTSRAAVPVATAPPPTPTTRAPPAPRATPRLSPAVETRAGPPGALSPPRVPELSRLLPPPRPTRPPSPLLRQPRPQHHRPARRSCCARGTAPVRVGARGRARGRRG